MVLPLTVSHERSRAALKLTRHRRVRLEEGVSKLMSRMMWTGGIVAARRMYTLGTRVLWLPSYSR